ACCAAGAEDRMRRLGICLIVLALGCGTQQRNTGGKGGHGGSGGSGGSGGTGGSGGNVPPGCLSTGGDPYGDQDQDGFSPMQGDCDDCNPSINPGAIQIPGDPTDYACNGMP